MEHPLAVLLILVRANDRLCEAFHEVGFVYQIRLYQAALLCPAHEIFDSYSWVSMWLARIEEEDSVDHVEVLL